MDIMFRTLTLVLAAGALMSVPPAQEPEFSPELLAFLDPTARVTNLCGGSDGNGSMRAKLLAAAAILANSGGEEGVPLRDGLGNTHFPITTTSPIAQRYFDQGLSFAYGFNHAAAIASFREAQRLDAGCALCFWGEALAHGPNINAPMDPKTNARAVALARHANWLSRDATPAEQALTAAMLKRYSPELDADRADLDGDYADAMLVAARANPSNDDIVLLAAEAAMDTSPWNYWLPDKSPQPRLGEAVQFVETVLARNPKHPQAAHLYIHLMENGPDPKRAEIAADRLAEPLAPNAGHLVHMPAHIYYRLGRWKDSIRVNVDAARADETWINASGDKGMVRYGYYPHNVHFIVTSAQMAGDMPTAIREARKLDKILDPAISSQIGWIQVVHAAPYFAAAQFATPAQILAMRPPDTRLPYPTAMRHYARAVARANESNGRAFEQELGKLRAMRLSLDWKEMVDQGVPAPDLLQLAELVAQARWAYSARDYHKAARLYREATTIEEKIPYMEPPYWYYPVHQSLGAALYRAGQYDAARDAFNAAIARSPNNGWALYGLALTERAMGRRAHAAAAELALKRVWVGNPRWLKIDRL